MSRHFYFGRIAEPVADLKEYLDICLPACVDFIVNPLYRDKITEFDTVEREQQGSESSILLDNNTWCNRIVGQVSSTIHLDDTNEKECLRSEQQFHEELDWAYYLGVPSLFCPELSHSSNSNYAAVINTWIDRKFTSPYWIPVDLTWSESDSTHSWYAWSQFHRQTDFSCGVQPCLRLSVCEPSDDVCRLWQGEPIECLIVPTSLLQWINNTTVHLSLHCQTILLWCKSQKTTRILIEGQLENECQQMQIIFNYIQTLFRGNQTITTVDQQIRSYHDVVQIPLQPLMDNLQNATYDIFERDLVKYDLYEDAIMEVLSRYRRHAKDNRAMYSIDRTLLVSSPDAPQGIPIRDHIIEENRIVITLVGAGRGPLIRCALRAAAKTKRDVIVIAIEKNSNAIVTLHTLHRTLQWGESVHIVQADMRSYSPEYYSDIILSELLGSLADNELSPECLIGAQRYLLSGGEFIPRDSTSFLACCMSTRIYNNIRKVNTLIAPLPLESTYVVKIHNAAILSEVQPLFTFYHPDQLNGNFRRYKELSFSTLSDGIVHGFSGYFESNLSNHVLLSIVPRTHSQDLVSWFPLFIPIDSPFYVKKGDAVKLRIWRRSDQKRVWYEWAVVSPVVTKIHNVNGKGQWIGL